MWRQQHPNRKMSNAESMRKFIVRMIRVVNMRMGQAPMVTGEEGEIISHVIFIQLNLA